MHTHTLNPTAPGQTQVTPLHGDISRAVAFQKNRSFVPPVGIADAARIARAGYSTHCTSISARNALAPLTGS